MSDSVSLEMCCFRGNDEATEPKSAGRATAFKVWSWWTGYRMHHLFGCSVFFGVSLHFSWTLLQCISWFWMTEKVEGGTKYSSVPKRPPSSVWTVFVVPVLGHRPEEWRVYQSYIVMVSGALSVIPLFLWENGPPVWCSCVLSEEVDAWGGGCRVGLWSALVPERGVWTCRDRLIRRFKLHNVKDKLLLILVLSAVTAGF